MAATRATLTPLSCSPNFLRASYLDIRTLTHEPVVNFSSVRKDLFSTYVMLVRWRTSVNLFIGHLIIKDSLLKSPTRRRDCCHSNHAKVEPFARQRQYRFREIIEPATSRCADRAQNNGMSKDNVPSEWRLERPKSHLPILLTGHGFLYSTTRN